MNEDQVKEIKARGVRWLKAINFNPTAARRANPDDEGGFLIFHLLMALAYMTAERNTWNADAQRLSGGLLKIHTAPKTATVPALSSVAYDIALNCIPPDVAEYQIEQRSKG